MRTLVSSSVSAKELLELVDGLLLGALRHGGHGLDVLHVGLGLGQLLLDAAQLRLGPLQGRRLPLQLLWRAGRVKLKIDS